MRKTANKIKRLVRKRPDILITDDAYQMATLRYAPEMAGILWEVKKAFEKGIDPVPYEEGCSNTYFLKDLDGRPIAVFKLEHRLREVAAYRMDHQGFAGVPPTVLTTLEHHIWGGKETGSCQLFVKESKSVVELDSRLLLDLTPHSVRRIAVLDTRIMNEDRHTSNMLVIDLKHVIPIDHGYSFARDLSDIHFGWMEWNQSATPFSSAELSYISLLDPEADRRILIDELHFNEKWANRLFVATVLLKLAATRMFLPKQIGDLMIRKHAGKKIPSSFEHLLATLREKNPPNWTLFSRYVYQEVERTLDAYEKYIDEC